MMQGKTVVLILGAVAFSVMGQIPMGMACVLSGD